MKFFKRITNFYANWRNNLVSSTRFQNWVSGVPLIRNMVTKDGEQLYDLVAGFVYSQTLLALVELGVFSKLRSGMLNAQFLAMELNISIHRLSTLCQAGVAIKVLTRVDVEGQHYPNYRLSRLGAALLGVPGLQEMIKHHRLFYADLLDPVSLLKNQTKTRLSEYWPYVSGENQGDDIDLEISATYSNLMKSSQQLVADETLRVFDFGGVKSLLDVGGGTGAFITRVVQRHQQIRASLFDLPKVIEQARKLKSSEQSKAVISFYSGNFLVDPLPSDVDAISLIRVLYDHNDDVVKNLLSKVFDVLPPGGMVLISEPMSGGVRPNKSGDAYFGFYTMAMTTGRPRDVPTHKMNLSQIGFQNIKTYSGTRNFITSVITARKPF